MSGASSMTSLSLLRGDWRRVPEGRGDVPAAEEELHPVHGVVEVQPWNLGQYFVQGFSVADIGLYAVYKEP